MNVIVANKYQFMLENLGIDIIKDLKGEFSVEEIIGSFQNFFYQRMILDITAIKNYRDIRNLQKLSISLEMDKVILLLDGTSETNSPQFISELISMGVYNFARTVEDIQYLYNTPNTYRDVAQYHMIGSVGSQNNSLNSIIGNMGVDKAKKVETDSASIMPTYEPVNPVRVSMARIIGFKNLTKHAGATTLVYILKRALEQRYKVCAIEIDRTDFHYFNDKSLISIAGNEIGSVIRNNNDKEIILIDANSSELALSLCNEVIYLMEPSIIRINKLLTVNPTIMPRMKGKNIVLNKSLLTPKDVTELQSEAGVKVFYNMPPLNEREKNNQNVLEFLSKLGIGI